MQKGIRLLPVILLTFVSFAPSTTIVLPTVRIESGRIEGNFSDEVVWFKGVPYAAPPTGNLRWRAPQRVEPWGDVIRKVHEYGHDCMQKLEPNDQATLRTEPSEDCLVLNIWRPIMWRSDERLPVMVWIHGGAYVNGGTSPEIFDGTAFAQQEIVFVSINYRLGRFGFFAHPALIAAKEGLVGNFGYMDQIEALRWINRNIGRFGGDPEKVTLMGESAGGDSVLHLILSPEAKGLFQRAIVMSGGGRSALAGDIQLRGETSGRPSAEQAGLEFAKSIGVNGIDADALAALRNLPAEKIAGDLNMSRAMQRPRTFSGGPVVDGKIVTASPQEILQRDEAANVTLMIGTTNADLPVTLPPSRESPLSYFGANADRARRVYNPDGRRNVSEVFHALAVDITMQEPARFVARQMTDAGNPVWLYRFSYVPDSLRARWTGAPHASELPFAFNTLDVAYGDEITDEDRSVAKQFHIYISNFVKNGDPNGLNLPRWPKFDSRHSELLNFTPDDGALFQQDPWKDRLDLVEQVADEQSKSRQNLSADLGGTSWQLVKIQYSDETTLTPENKTKYTIAFGKDGGVSAGVDCNHGSATWKSSGPSHLEFGPLAITRMMCPAGSLQDRILKDWDYFRAYTIQHDHLFLSLMADSGVYEFEPVIQSNP